MVEGNVIDLLKRVVGKDENGYPKAIVVLQDQHFYNRDGEMCVACDDEAGTSDAVVAVAIDDDVFKISLTFDGFEDLDYIRFHAMVMQYCSKEIDRDAHTLAITISDNETQRVFVVSQISSIIFDGKDPIIRISASTQKSIAYEMSEDESAEMEDELLSEDDMDEYIDDEEYGDDDYEGGDDQ